MSIYGFDVSAYQGHIDWTRAAAAAKFVGIKATEGRSYLDPYHAQNMAQAKLYNLPRFVYHFAHPELNTPQQEADWYLQNAGLEKGDLPVLDIEVGNRVGNWTVDWLHAIMKYVTVPCIYTYSAFVPAFADNLNVASWSLLLANYAENQPSAPYPWTRLFGWQYASTGSVPGIVGRVDLDMIFAPWEGAHTAGVSPMGSTNVLADAQVRWQALGVGANLATAIFAAYASRYAAWVASGKQPVLDPTPCVRAETSAPDGHVYAAFDNGEIYDYHDGQVFLVEVPNRENIFKECNW